MCHDVLYVFLLLVILDTYFIVASLLFLGFLCFILFILLS